MCLKFRQFRIGVFFLFGSFLAEESVAEISRISQALSNSSIFQLAREKVLEKKRFRRTPRSPRSQKRRSPRSPRSRKRRSPRSPKSHKRKDSEDRQISKISKKTVLLLLKYLEVTILCSVGVHSFFFSRTCFLLQRRNCT